jgi:hypothetical protein
LLGMHISLIHLKTDARYKEEQASHLIWHEVLRGFLLSNLDLQRIYVGKVTELGDDTDQIAYDAIMKDLNDRRDTSSPIAVINNDRIYIDLNQSNSEYERMARSLALRIIVAHPLDVIDGIPEKLSEQIVWFTLHRAMTPSNLLGATALVALAGVFWWMAGGGRTRISDLLSGAAASVLVLACSLVPVLIAPSYLSVGTLLCFLVVAVVSAFLLFALAERTAQVMLVRRTQKPAADATHVI